TPLDVGGVVDKEIQPAAMPESGGEGIDQRDVIGGVGLIGVRKDIPNERLVAEGCAVVSRIEGERDDAVVGGQSGVGGWFGSDLACGVVGENVGRVEIGNQID